MQITTVDEIESLRKEVAYHNYLYHVCDRPVISDYEFDFLYETLKKLELENPECFSENSPTQKIDGYFDRIKKPEDKNANNN